MFALPLVPAAGLAAALALLGTVFEQIGLALIAGMLAGAAASALGIASADRARRFTWWAVGCASLGVSVRLLFGPLAFDLRHVAPLDRLRDALAAPIARLLPEPEAGLILGIVLGERTSIGPDLIAAFNATGTTHLLAISGFNLTLVSGAVAAMTRGWLGPVRSSALAVAAVLGYSLLVGLQPSVLRALLMAIVGAVAVTIGRRGAAANALAAAVLVMLALDPRAVGDAGALLSVCATAGLVAWQRSLATRLSPLPTVIREGLAATLAATLPTLPLIAGMFGRVSLVAPLANLVAVPLFTPILAFGAITSVVGALYVEAAVPLAFVSWGFATLLRRTVEIAAGIPGSSVALPAGPVTGVGLALIMAGAVAAARVDALAPLRRALSSWVRRVLAARRPRRRSTGVALGVAGPRWGMALLVGTVAVALLAAIVITPHARLPAVRVIALDVGQGDAYLVQANGRTALIDGGPDPARLLAQLGATLPPWQRRIDLIALTHAHLDHGAGLLAVLDRYQVGLAIEPAGLNDGPLREAWKARLARTGTAHRAVQAGDRVRMGELTFAVLSPNDDPRIDVPSLVLRFELRRFSMLFMGDATDPALEDLLLAPAALAARVYVPPHHGASTPLAPSLVGAVGPEAAVLSLGASNRYGHPTPDTLAALRRIVTYRTDRDGSVAIESDGLTIGVRTHVNGLAPPRPGGFPHMPRGR